MEFECVESSLVRIKVQFRWRLILRGITSPIFSLYQTHGSVVYWSSMARWWLVKGIMSGREDLMLRSMP